MALTTIDETETTKRLTAWAAIIAVPMVFEGLWGMNFKYMPELEWSWGYPMALAFIIIGSVAVYVGFKKSNWL